MSDVTPAPAPRGAWMWIVDAGYALAGVLLLSMAGSIVAALVPVPAWLVTGSTWALAGAGWALVRSHDTQLPPGPGRAVVGGAVAMGLAALTQPGVGPPSVWVAVDVAAGTALFAWAALLASRWVARSRREREP